ncbi:hypothetical protein [Legionella quinlivanii]|uniref:hypothetical protein n=1 Tax=Legionella quinlivanii TaxID=45073 RepID=UPI0011BE1A87|nr:hypothetical protein [Legionella quinlivanii]
MMKKLVLILLASYLLPFSSSYAEKIICPQSITCNYEEGSCDISSDWFYVNATIPEIELPGDPIPLAVIGASANPDSSLGYRFPPSRNFYTLRCTYLYGKGANIILSR